MLKDVKVSAINLLRHMKPLQEWAAELTAEERAELTRAHGSPEAFYLSMRTLAQAQIDRPSPRTIRVAPHRSARFKG